MPFSSYKATLKHELNGEKWDVGHLPALGSAVWFCCFGVPQVLGLRLDYLSSCFLHKYLCLWLGYSRVHVSHINNYAWGWDLVSEFASLTWTLSCPVSIQWMYKWIDVWIYYTVLTKATYAGLYHSANICLAQYCRLYQAPPHPPTHTHTLFFFFFSNKGSFCLFDSHEKVSFCNNNPFSVL